MLFNTVTELDQFLHQSLY